MTATRAREHNWLSSTPSIIYNQPVERTSFFLAIILDSWNPSPYSLDRESIVKYSYIMDSLPAISAGTFLIMVWHTSINQAIVCPIIAVVFSYEFSREQQQSSCTVAVMRFCVNYSHRRDLESLIIKVFSLQISQ